jgi:ureidoglycolate lyase
MLFLEAEPLTPDAFAPYGDVITSDATEPLVINDGTCERFDNLATIDVVAHGGQPNISLFRATPRALPFEVSILERHPLSSQAFYPLDRTSFLVVVCDNSEVPWHDRVRAFRVPGTAGVNLRRGTWHHSLIALGQVSRFIVFDRRGPGENCDEIELSPGLVILA